MLINDHWVQIFEDFGRFCYPQKIKLLKVIKLYYLISEGFVKSLNYIIKVIKLSYFVILDKLLSYIYMVFKQLDYTT